MTDSRKSPDLPFLAVSAAIFRGERVLLVRRTKPPSGLYTLPGGMVESGETLIDAVRREVEEETGLAIEPLGLAGFREVITRADNGEVARHFVILPFAARWLSGEVRLNAEADDARWVTVAEIAPLQTTEGLEEIVAAAMKQLASAR